MNRLPVAPGYEPLAAVLDEALAQAQSGKGKERHASGEPFLGQPIISICEELGSGQFAIGQAAKKSRESLRLPPDRARRELLGAINYLAAAVLVIDRSTVRALPDNHNFDEGETHPALDGIAKGGDL